MVSDSIGMVRTEARHKRVERGLAALAELQAKHYTTATRYTTSAFMRMKLGAALPSRQAAAHIFGKIREFGELLVRQGVLAEVEDWLDTPFRHFSSGMQVRLGFSAVTQLDEPIILIDDEDD